MNPPALATLSLHVLATRPPPADSGSPLLALTTGLARGEDAAWAQFHREFGPMIFRQLLAATRGDQDLASEALQQTYLRVAKHLRPCEAEPQFLAWLRMVARSALSDCRRRQSSFWRLLRRRQTDPVDDRATGDDAQHEEQLQRSLDAALAALEPEERTLLELKYLGGRDVRSIAETIGVSPKAIESRLTRARARLRAQLLTTFRRHE